MVYDRQKHIEELDRLIALEEAELRDLEACPSATAAQIKFVKAALESFKEERSQCLNGNSGAHLS